MSVSPAANAPVSTSVSAALSPTAASSLSPSASALAVSPAAEPLVEDDADDTTNSTVDLDLAKAETRLLAKISETLKPDQDDILYSVQDNAPTDKPGEGVVEVDVLALYAELAKRTVAEDKDARQALVLAALRGDKRANDAKEEAYEDRIAESLIKRIENGDQGAKDELMKFALHGNMRARDYLGLDKAPVQVGIPEAMTPTAGALGTTASAGVHQNLSASASSAATPLTPAAGTKNPSY
jgi:hypothetical protein